MKKPNFWRKDGSQMSEAQGYTFWRRTYSVMIPEAYIVDFWVGRKSEEYFRLKRLEPMYDAYFKDERKFAEVYYNQWFSGIDEDEWGLGQETALGFLQYLSEIYKRYQVIIRSLHYEALDMQEIFII